jgi:hypothetical protein
VIDFAKRNGLLPFDLLSELRVSLIGGPIHDGVVVSGLCPFEDLPSRDIADENC